MSKPLTAFALSLVLLSANSAAFAATKPRTVAPTPPPPPVVETAPSYGDMVLLKLESGLANMATGMAEIPKNMYNVANGSASPKNVTTNRPGDLLFGITGGGLKGALHALGRTVSGVVDFATCLIPSKPITNPPFVWQNFSVDTQYGPFLKTAPTALRR